MMEVRAVWYRRYSPSRAVVVRTRIVSGCLHVHRGDAASNPACAASILPETTTTRVSSLAWTPSNTRYEYYSRLAPRVAVALLQY